MFFPDALASEEASAAAVASRWPFLEVRELLESRGVDVPRLLAEDCDAGWLLVEDLGDRTLAEALGAAPELETQLYQRVVRDLARAHDSLAELPASSIVARRAFEVELLEWEIDHFREWGLEARGIHLGPERESAFKRLAHRWAEAVRRLPYGFSHRDFQSRNLMVTAQPGGDRLVWIDFQDALLGPRVYDLVALLGDSYQSFSEEFVQTRLAEYAELRGLPHELPAIRREFDLVTVQRKLKDAGRFVFIQHKKGDAGYLRFVEPTIALVRRSLARLSDDSDAAELEALLSDLLD